MDSRSSSNTSPFSPHSNKLHGQSVQHRLHALLARQRGRGQPVRIVRPTYVVATVCPHPRHPPPESNRHSAGPCCGGTGRPRGIGCRARCVSAWDTMVTHHLEAKLLQNVPRHFLRAGQLGPSLETEARGRLRTMPIQSGALSAWPNQLSSGLLVKTGPVSACLAQPARRLNKKMFAPVLS